MPRSSQAPARQRRSLVSMATLLLLLIMITCFSVPVVAASSSANVTQTRYDELIAKVERLETAGSERADRSHILRSGSLVLSMQIGFGMMEAGLVQPKNLVNIMMKNVAGTCFSGLSFYLFGWGLAYGDTAGGILGVSQFLTAGGGNASAAWFFNFSFAAMTATIVSGAIAERASYNAYCIFAFLLTGFVYPIVLHWAWSPSGWLAALGFFDFAGSGVIHVLGGASALAAAGMLGPRRGRFRSTSTTGGQRQPVPLPLGDPRSALVGLFLLWFGWYGANPGSTMGFSNGLDIVAGHASVATTLAACAGVVVSLAVSWLRFQGTTTVDHVLSGTLGGLVAISSCCNVVSEGESVLIGAIGGAIAIVTSELVLAAGIDDPVSAIGVHLGGGVWGVVAAGIFAAPEATGNYSPVGVTSGSWDLLGVQVIGALAIAAWGLISTMLLLWLANLAVPFRVTAEEELFGLDYAAHSMIRRELLELLSRVAGTSSPEDVQKLRNTIIGNSVIDVHQYGSQSSVLKEWQQIRILFPGLLPGSEAAAATPGMHGSVSSLLKDLAVQKPKRHRMSLHSPLQPRMQDPPPSMFTHAPDDDAQSAASARSSESGTGSIRSGVASDRSLPTVPSRLHVAPGMGPGVAARLGAGGPIGRRFSILPPAQPRSLESIVGDLHAADAQVTAQAPQPMPVVRGARLAASTSLASLRLRGNTNNAVVSPVNRPPAGRSAFNEA